MNEELIVRYRIILNSVTNELPNKKYKSKEHLLVKKEPFLKMLNENNLDIVWTLLGEKDVIGGSLTSNHHYGSIEFSGTFYFDNGELNGVNKIHSN